MDNSKKSFLWYDYETFSRDKYNTRIASVAMMRTNLSFDVLEEPVVCFGKLGLDFLPSPRSCIIHGLSPQFVNTIGTTEDILISKVLEEFSKDGTIVVGYNSIQFDDEITRATLYRNLMDPHTGWAKNRWDILKLVRATRDFKPETLVLEKTNSETGWTSFRLEDVAEQNGIEQIKAHDAINDVLATVGIAKQIKEKQPDLFEYYFNLRTPEQIAQFFSNESDNRIILFTDSTPINGHKFNTRPLVPLHYEKRNGKLEKVVCFDLSNEVPETINEETRNCLIELNIKKSPFIVRAKYSHDMEARSGLKWETCIERRKRVLDNPIFASLAGKKRKFEKTSNDPDVNIYEFPSFAAKETMKNIVALPPEYRLKQHRPFHDGDEKFNEILFRHVARNYPDLLTDIDKQAWIRHCRSKITGIEDNTPTTEPLYIHDYFSTIEELEVENKDSSELLELLSQLRKYGEYVKKQLGLTTN